MAAEDILLEGSHADIAMWPSSRGEVAVPAPLLPDDSFGDTAVEYRLGEEARDVSFGDTAVEYLLAEAAEEDLCFGAGSAMRRGVMCVMVSFCSNGLPTSWFTLSASEDPSARVVDAGAGLLLTDASSLQELALATDCSQVLMSTVS